MNAVILAQLFGISRQWYYKMQGRNRRQKAQQEEVKKRVLAVRKVMPRLGGRKLYHMLKPSLGDCGHKLGRDKLFDLLREEHLLVKKRKNYTRTTQSYHRFRKYPNRIKETEVTRPEQVWASDITYIRTLGGFLYLSLITDSYSRKIVGYELSDNMKAENSVRAMERAVKHRRYPTSRLIHHSDRGFQYCSPEYVGLLTKHGIEVSMTTRYDPYENAQAERVNGILKDEFYLDKTFQNAKEAGKAVEQSIKVYNTLRPHLSCDFLTPEQAHREGKYKMKKWGRNFSSKGYPLDEKTNYI